MKHYFFHPFPMFTLIRYIVIFFSSHGKIKKNPYSFLFEFLWLEIIIHERDQNPYEWFL